MDITPSPSGDVPIIRGYGGGAFRINGQDYAHAVLVLPHRTLPWSGEVMREALSPALDAEIDLLLLGGGGAPQPVPSELRDALRAAGIAVEAMDTGAACRTYNVLALEGRRVGAALRLV